MNMLLMLLVVAYRAWHLSLAICKKLFSVFGFRFRFSVFVFVFVFDLEKQFRVTHYFLVFVFGKK
jgi:hypothetical protein